MVHRVLSSCVHSRHYTMWHVYVHSIYRDCMYTWDVIMITKALLSPSCILANHPGYPLDVWLSNLWSFKHVKPLLVFHWYPFLAGYSATGQDDHHWPLNSPKGLKHVEITKHNQSCLRLVGIPGVHQVIKSRWGIRNPNHQPKPRAIRFWLKQQMFDASLPPNIKHPSRNLVLPMSSTGSTHIWGCLILRGWEYWILSGHKLCFLPASRCPWAARKLMLEPPEKSGEMACHN